MQVNLGGIVHLSTVDWPGRAAMVIFLRGCPLRCPHCHNRELQMGETFAELSRVLGHIKVIKEIEHMADQLTLEEAISMTEAEPFLTALVLSGGEPLMQPNAALAIANLARGLGMDVGIETCGYYYDHLQRFLDKGLADGIFLDIKAPLREKEYQAVTGKKGSALRALKSLKICMKSEVSFEVRTTVFPETNPLHVQDIAKSLSDLLAKSPGNQFDVLVLQQGQPRDKEFEPLSLESLKALAESIRDLRVEVRAASLTKANK
ncbi:MAG: anaerobic ribonucleoside-triphosphate reductase activating protein [Methanotrichaceae archaeon]